MKIYNKIFLILLISFIFVFSFFGNVFAKTATNEKGVSINVPDDIGNHFFVFKDHKSGMFYLCSPVIDCENFTPLYYEDWGKTYLVCYDNFKGDNIKFNVYSSSVYDFSNATLLGSYNFYNVPDNPTANGGTRLWFYIFY